MKKKHSTIVLLIVGGLIGLLTTLHLKTPFVIESDFPAEEIEAKEELKKAFLDEQTYLQSRIVSLRGDIEELQELLTTQSENSAIDYLDTLKEKLGLSEVSGEGIEVYLDDSPFALREGANATDINLVQASDVRDVVNALNVAKAEGISINGQRVIATSPISSVGTTILINNAYIAPPFTISAVGDPAFLIQRLLENRTLTDIYKRMDSSRLVFEVVAKNKVVIPIYNSDLKTNYIEIVE